MTPESEAAEEARICDRFDARFGAEMDWYYNRPVGFASCLAHIARTAPDETRGFCSMTPARRKEMGRRGAAKRWAKVMAVTV